MQELSGIQSSSKVSSQNALLTAYTESTEIISIEIPFDAKVKRLSSKILQKPVRRHSNKFKIPTNLIFAVIETESAFNPRAISPIPAYGLMQLVPKSGGVDAYEFVFGEKRIVEMEYLFVPEQNIQLGSSLPPSPELPLFQKDTKQANQTLLFNCRIQHRSRQRRSGIDRNDQSEPTGSSCQRASP